MGTVAYDGLSGCVPPCMYARGVLGAVMAPTARLVDAST